MIQTLMVLWLGLPTAAVWAADNSKPGNGQLEEIVIEGVPRIEVQADKPDYEPNPDPAPSILAFLAKQLHVPDLSSKVMLMVPNYLPSAMSSSLARTPWRVNLVQPPVLDVQLKQPAGLEVLRWRLVVTDDRGKIFHTIKGKGKLPNRISWDGRGDSGDMLRVGHPYAYSYHILDMAEVPSYIPGKNILLRSLVLANGGQCLIHLDTPVIFERANRLSPEGVDYIREAQDFLREAATGSLRITIYGDDQELAKRQAELLRRHFAAALNMPVKRIQATGAPLGRDGYARTEIETK
ncbi:MAG: hypothetical protein WC881_04140 [Elusimicrobiota bacterium]|jgi:hypothetical protein